MIFDITLDLEHSTKLLEASGLTSWFGQSITRATGGGLAEVFLLAFSTLAFSAVASNTASSSIFIPIAISVGLGFRIKPGDISGACCYML